MLRNLAFARPNDSCRVPLEDLGQPFFWAVFGVSYQDDWRREPSARLSRDFRTGPGVGKNADGGNR